ncbi:MAG: NAD-dependent epimerase/dehydratase family protein [Aquisalimonadaceae bacterium]
MKILVTGATGFIGGHLAIRLLQHGHRVRALVRRDSNAVEHVRGLGCEIAHGDLLDEASLRAAIAGTEVVYHLGAALTGTWQHIEAVTVRGTERMLRLSLEAEVDRFVHISSLAVYRMADIPENAIIDESRPLEPDPQRVGFYCRSKVEAERLVFDYHRRGLPVVVVRPGLVYGPRGNVFWPNIGYLKNRICILPGSGDAFLPLTHVDNVVDAILLAGRAAGVVGKAYHIADGNGMTKTQYLRRYLAATGARARVVEMPLPLLSSPAAASELLAGLGFRVPFPNRYALKSKYRGIRCDTSRAQWAMGWKPRVSLDEGLERTFAWYNRSRVGRAVAAPAR